MYYCVYSDDGNNYFALINPSVDNLKNYRQFYFRIKKLPNNSCVSFGLLHFNQNNISSNLFKEVANIGGRAYTLSSNGYRCSHTKLDQNGQTEFRAQVSDTIVMEYYPKGSIVFYNKNKPSKRICINFSKDEKQPLFVCVKMSSKTTQVQLLQNK